jgi:PIN domain nuclease of toxin-antitoxin system
VTTVLLDTHVLHWWAVEPERVSPTAARALEGADELAVAAISWFELGWLIQKGKVEVRMPLRAWITQLARDVRTVALTPAIAATAAELPDSFPRDPVDRIIFATAVEHGFGLATRDRQMQLHDAGRDFVVW